MVNSDVPQSAKYNGDLSPNNCVARTEYMRVTTKRITNALSIGITQKPMETIIRFRAWKLVKRRATRRMRKRRSILIGTFTSESRKSMTSETIETKSGD